MDFTKKLKSLVHQGSYEKLSRKSMSSQSLDDSGARVGSSGAPKTPSLNALREIQENHLPIVSGYVKEKESRFSQQDIFLSNPELEEEVLHSIDPLYYVPSEGHESFSSEDHVMDRLPENLDLGYIIGEKKRLNRQLLVVSKKVSDLILQHQPAYVQELKRVTQLQESLSETIKICTRSRHHLDRSKKDFTFASLNIVANYKRREVLKGLLKSLLTIKTLQQTDVRLRELLDDDEDYSGAVQLCLECQKVAISLRHYKCVSELSSKLSDTLEMTEEQIDVALSKICTSFNEQVYAKLQNTYKLLGKTQAAIDQLLMHFASVIHNKTFSIVLGYVELCSTDDKKSENFQKKQYNELCLSVTTECFIPCLTDLCKALWDVMFNYQRVLAWHRVNDEDTSDCQVSESDDVEASFNKRFVKQRLEHGLSRVWQDVQQKLRVFISGHDLSVYSFDEFIKVLRIARRMMDIGVDFCGSKSEDLEDSLNKQTINYFRNYHKASMDELKMFLENEMWQICPVKANFTVSQLQEFHFLRSKEKFYQFMSTPANSPSKRSSLFFSNGLFERSNSFETPFDSLFEDNTESDMSDETGNDRQQDLRPESRFADSDDDINDELNREAVDEEEDRIVSKKSVSSLELSELFEGPLVTNTTLNVLRLFGKYMQMMWVLNTIAFDVLICMFHLFDYYLYTVYLFFGKEMVEMSDSILSSRLKLALKRIRDTLIVESAYNNEAIAADHNMRFFAPFLSDLVNQKVVEKLYGLSERVVGVESLVLLSNQFASLQQYFEGLIPEAKKTILNQYFAQTVSVAADLRKPIYVLVAVKSVDYEEILSQMTTVKWDVREIMSQHNSYVDVLLRELQVFSMRLEEVCRSDLGAPLPRDAYNILWDQVLKLANRTFVEGFSQAKKCTNEGRALMQLDFQQFLTKVDKMTTIKPVPERDLVEEYIKAYYLPDVALEQWIRSRKEYTAKQLLSLVLCMTSDNKKARIKLTAVVEAEFGNSFIGSTTK